MCDRNCSHKIEASAGCVRETPQIKMKQHGMLKRDSADKNENSTGCVRETPRIRKRTVMGCVRETPHRKIKPAWDV